VTLEEEANPVKLDEAEVPVRSVSCEAGLN